VIYVENILLDTSASTVAVVYDISASIVAVVYDSDGCTVLQLTVMVAVDFYIGARTT